jgi:hypothetical protein
MLDRLDDIPWKSLTHAYGPAEDVPDLLHNLRTAPAGIPDEQSPLWHLFGNIWHQGSVYEATAYAVPFLIELAACSLVPDRLGILALLAAIATGSSFRHVHGNLLNEPDFAERKAVELKWVEQAHAAVAHGVADVLAMTREETDVRLAAAHVLALLPEHREVVGVRLRSMVSAEIGSVQRAGLLLLFGLAGDRSEATLSVLTGVLLGDDLLQRRGAALAFAYLNPKPLPELARVAILDAIAADDLEDSFEGLPWDVLAEVDREKLHACLDAADREKAATTGIVAIEAGNATHQTISTVLSLIFPLRLPDQSPPLSSSDLSPLQKRAVRAMSSAMEDEWRIFYGSFALWGLPETTRNWRTLAFDDSRRPIGSNLP